MLDVPPHLLQPLSVDTNISYDLDMSKFPGLDDPHQMYEPALLIATDWSQYVYSDEDSNSEFPSISSDCSSFSEDDLFCLIESCDIPEMDTSTMDSDTFQTLLDDIITDTDTPCDVRDILDTSDNSLSCDTDTTHVDTSVDTTDINYHSTDDCLPSLTSCVRGQKRRRTSDSEFIPTKKSKTADSTSLSLPPLVSVCPTSFHCVMHRDS